MVSKHRSDDDDDEDDVDHNIDYVYSETVNQLCKPAYVILTPLKMSITSRHTCIQQTSNSKSCTNIIEEQMSINTQIHKHHQHDTCVSGKTRHTGKRCQ